MNTVIFDFDNTIANTTSLEGIRKSQAWSSLSAEAMVEVSVYPKALELLVALKAAGVRMAIVTNSPAQYLQAVLNHLRITDYFDVLVTYTDVGVDGKKPSPAGINLALEKLGIQPSLDIAYVGDDRIDYEAAYKAGVLPVMPTWADPISVSTPPAIEMSSSMLLEFANNSQDFKLMAERCADLGILRKPSREHYILALDESASVVSSTRQMVGICLGRYFSRNSEITAPLHSNHSLSRQIAEKEEGDFVIPQAWVDMLVHVILKSPAFLFEDGRGFDLVTVIPAKLGKDPRLERLLEMVADNLTSQGSSITFDAAIFYYLDDAKSQKTLMRTEREDEAVRSLHLASGKVSKIQGQRVLIIDDVVTTGATLRRARTLLKENGAASCYGLAIAKTVSIAGTERQCETCGRVMRVRTNRNTGELFWGCTGFFEDKACTAIVDIVTRTCRVCGDPMRVKKSRENKMFWGCTGYVKNRCTYTESY